jgi:hypothetical protein
MPKGPFALEDIVDYLKKNLRKGYTKESLRWALTNQGYSKLEIEKAMRKVDQEMAEEAPVLRTKPQIRYERIEPVQEERKSWWRRLLGS